MLLWATDGRACGEGGCGPLLERVNEQWQVIAWPSSPVCLVVLAQSNRITRCCLSSLCHSLARNQATSHIQPSLQQDTSIGRRGQPRHVEERAQDSLVGRQGQPEQEQVLDRIGRRGQPRQKRALDTE